MAINIETAINHMESLKAKGVTYSMYGSRVGTDGTADCSGAIFASLRKAGAYNPGWILNTDSMHAWLLNLGFSCIATNKEWTAKRGDIVIFGKKGASGGAAGHVVIFTSQSQIIHCNYPKNGVTIDNEATTCPYSMGWYVYRLSNSSKSEPSQPNDKGLEWIESGSFKLIENNVALRSDKKTSSKLIARLTKGDVVKYDRAYKAPNNYIWIRQKRASGYAWIATGETDKNNKRVSSWGNFY
ncbi:hypothetical protein BAU15_05420 [Enterococcus sp. JM4C]|uniref:peptidoglycan amidohydrolase family protein n=1 Tax=Candidatus Enterococcus huntleyi TaxID=1857217 RepID=UPI001379E53B|nr:peptidoglycan amidohydrolase family protein [Enterococcus sp. JM4C]KAF1295191.1 hypothetical protein BAU15_05420 [Enterococcus sp. JM4C]